MAVRSADRAFSLVELVIVLVIIGIVAAIAVPRITRGATRASAVALRSDLATLRNAIELYRAEHEGALPAVGRFADQMTKFSNLAGNAFSTSPDVANGIVLGPYLKAIPPLPVGARRGATGVAAVSADGVGWIYTEATGRIRANTLVAEIDASAILFSTY